MFARICYDLETIGRLGAGQALDTSDFALKAADNSYFNSIARTFARDSRARALKRIEHLTSDALELASHILESRHMSAYGVTGPPEYFGPQSRPRVLSSAAAQKPHVFEEDAEAAAPFLERLTQLARLCVLLERLPQGLAALGQTYINKDNDQATANELTELSAAVAKKTLLLRAYITEHIKAKEQHEQRQLSEAWALSLNHDKKQAYLRNMEKIQETQRIKEMMSINFVEWPIHSPLRQPDDFSLASSSPTTSTSPPLLQPLHPLRRQAPDFPGIVFDLI